MNEERSGESIKSKREVAEKITTRIWYEKGKKDNRFYPEKSICWGYDFYGDLLGRYSWTELLFLLLRGELPDEKENRILNYVMCSVMNHGPRDWSVRAGMNAAIGKTTIGNCLIAGLAVLQGSYCGAMDMEDAMRMFQKGLSLLKEEGVEEAVLELLKEYPEIPGYGLLYSERDMRAVRLIELVKEEGFKEDYLRLAIEIEKIVVEKEQIWLTLGGTAGVILLDLGFTPEQGAGIFLLSGSAGILAHSLEQLPKDWNEYPMYWNPEWHIYEGTVREEG
ncbi:MAG: citryl-CoA lyase [Desulfobacterales bacterium]|nr:citryl-CoA lyase [Desulfobacterales bacterium]